MSQADLELKQPGMPPFYSGRQTTIAECFGFQFGFTALRFNERR